MHASNDNSHVRESHEPGLSFAHQASLADSSLHHPRAHPLGSRLRPPARGLPPALSAAEETMQQPARGRRTIMLLPLVGQEVGELGVFLPPLLLRGVQAAAEIAHGVL